MGESLNGGYVDETPVHNVFVSAFYVINTEVTKWQWETVRNWAKNGNGYNDLPIGGGRESSHAVHAISWYSMIKWCNAKSQMDGLDPCYTIDGGQIYKIGNRDDVLCNWGSSGYRLPTEAEWEKAARGGLLKQRFPWGNTINHSHANYLANGNAYFYDTSPYTTFTHHPVFRSNLTPYTAPVGSFAPNNYDLYDMSGNVSEWCWDWWSPAYYSLSPDIDPRGPVSAPYNYKAVRGGSWGNDANYNRVARRYGITPDSVYDIGFRLVRSAIP